MRGGPPGSVYGGRNDHGKAHPSEGDPLPPRQDCLRGARRYDPAAIATCA